MTAYFGVISNRDFIKIDGEKRPFWEFLDVEPDGWLTSLAYRSRRHDTARPYIWDCGAWSYRAEETPTLRGATVSPEWAAEQYQEGGAASGDFTVAPDHMEIPGTDVASRRAFNRKSAKAFLRCAPPNTTPMAVVHGLDVAERVRNAKRLTDMGYRAVSIGGIAAQASQPKMAVAAVSAVAEAVPAGTWVHVLGLSSPRYFALWAELGISSCDGSSHFKQAFTAGAFFVSDRDRLVKHQAARTGEKVSAPECYCRACHKLRQQGIDTRTYGSNENNMGRAAHNLNHLMLAQKAAVLLSGGTLL